MSIEVVQQQLDRVLLFVVDVRLFSAFRKARPEDIKAAKGVEIHPDNVLTLGSQRVFDKERLNVFQRKKDAMHRACLKYGTAFLGGYAVPDDERADKLSNELQSIVKSAMDEKAELLKNYETWLDEFCAEHTQWAPQIRAKAFTKAYIEDRVHFAFSAMRISAARDAGILAETLEAEVGGLLSSLLRDVADVAEKLLAESLSGRQKVTRKALRPIKAIRDKLLGFVFLDPRLQAVTAMIDAVAAALPGDGPIEGADLAMLWGIAGVLADPRKLMALAETYEVHGPAAFLAAIRPQGPLPAPTVEPSAAVSPQPAIGPAVPLIRHTLGTQTEVGRSMPGGLPSIGGSLPAVGLAALAGRVAS